MPGVMGVLQALEAVKVIAGLGETYDGKMLMFDACSAARPFTVMKLRKRDTEKCLACADIPGCNTRRRLRLRGVHRRDVHGETKVKVPRVHRR